MRDLSLDTVSSLEDSVRLLRLPEVLQLVGIGKTSLYAMVKNGKFPRPIRLSERSVAWLSSDIRQWILGKVKEAEERNERSA